MKISKLCAVTALSLATVSCAGLNPEKPTVDLRGPAISKVVGPYDQAKACVARIPSVRTIRIGVDAISDRTGKTNVQTDGTGSFVTQGATDMMTTSLDDIGVQVVELSLAYKANVEWLLKTTGQKKASIKTPQFIVLGSVNSLDFGTYGVVAEAAVFGGGPRARAYRAKGGMDLRITSLPTGKTIGGSVQVTSAFQKEFVAQEFGVGMARFVGGGDGLTYASFNIGSSKREPMQATIRYMADYGAVDLTLKLLSKLGLHKDAVANCRQLLEDPYGTSSQKVQVAKAD